MTRAGENHKETCILTIYLLVLGRLIYSLIVILRCMYALVIAFLDM